ncbi:cytochrome c biogenesis CcdA family protein [Allorhizocola rhizosphaerae]|uniref:cytochrome c biogenesis CcdA family protein n=1 Tax=Allorhizocola rhizosphaerae TaxID=1872709 RepID=UPI000E3DA46F|nr:cytochrome c biogenesis protein CcdA [Allorhizocola rhizosphaerae]
MTDLVTGGPLIVALGIAALAGLVSFLSPCVLPLVPGYLAYVTGLVGADLDDPRPGRVVAGVGLFTAGFAAVFITISVLAAQAGRLLVQHDRVVQIAVGTLIIVLGVAFLGLIPGLQNEWRVHHLPRAGLLGAPVFGAVFALSWVPCLSPTLGAVLGLAGVGGNTGRAVVLAIGYCIGIGLPFLIFGLGMRRLAGVVQAIRRNSRWVTRIGGVMLIVVGLALVTGAWSEFITWLRATVGAGSIGI